MSEDNDCINGQDFQRVKRFDVCFELNSENTAVSSDFMSKLRLLASYAHETYYNGNTILELHFIELESGVINSFKNMLANLKKNESVVVTVNHYTLDGDSTFIQKYCVDRLIEYNGPTYDYNSDSPNETSEVSMKLNVKNQDEHTLRQNCHSELSENNNYCSDITPVSQEEFDKTFIELLGQCTKTVFLDENGYPCRVPTNRISLRNSDDEWMLDIQFTGKEHFWFSYERGWSILEDKYSLQYHDIERLMKNQVSTRFGMHDCTPRKFPYIPCTG